MQPPDSTHKPRVSVSMVTYRHEHWLAQAIESVLEQDMDDWEIILADDASDDRALDVARSYLGPCQGPHGQRLRILDHGTKFGPRQNYMRSLRACRGVYSSQLDGDDFFIDRFQAVQAVGVPRPAPRLCGGLLSLGRDRRGRGEPAGAKGGSGSMA